MKNIILFLTACVNPNGMRFTVLQDKKERIIQYADAANFYYKKTKYKILIVENTNYDMSQYLPQDKDRIEYLTFDGNKYNKELGKGYGEALIIKYASTHSKFYSQADTIIKITGRDKVLNINKIIKEIVNSSYVYANFITCEGRITCSSRLVAFPKEFLNNKFLPNSTRINDSRHYYFEDLLFDSSRGMLRPFCHPLLTEMISGTDGKKIKPGMLNILRATISYYVHKAGYYRIKF